LKIAQNFQNFENFDTILIVSKLIQFWYNWKIVSIFQLIQLESC